MKHLFQQLGKHNETSIQAAG